VPSLFLLFWFEWNLSAPNLAYFVASLWMEPSSVVLQWKYASI